MKESLFEIIVDWVIDPLLDMLFRRNTSGKWHFSYLLPVAVAVFAGLWFLSDRWEITWLSVLSAICLFFAGAANLFLFIPRRIGEWRDCESHIAKRKRESEPIPDEEND